MNTNWRSECTGIRSRAAHILKTGEYSDCTFMVGKEQNQEKISAHKMILAMASDTFHSMFYGEIAESGAVPIVDIEADVFKSLLVYIYTDEIHIKSFEKACELYIAADKYNLPHLMNECVTYLASNLDAENVLVAYEFAVFYGKEDLVELVDECIKVICEHAKDVLKASNFTETSLETVCMIYSMDPLNIDSEMDLFAAAERYLEANKDRAYPLEVDEAMNTDDNSPSETDQSSSSLNLQLSDTKARSSARFQFTVQNIETVKTYVYSPPFYVRNLPWKIMVGPERHQKFLVIYIECNAESKSTCWSCYATYSLSVISHNPDTEAICIKHEALFHSKNNHWGSDIAAWSDVLDPEKGYIKDGSITVEACIEADAPRGILGNSVKHIRSDDRRDKLTIRNAVTLIRFLTLTPEQFADEATNSTLLSESEEKAILINLVSKNPRIPMPVGFCTSSEKRQNTHINNFSFQYSRNYS